jgi:hypothetical protein
MSYINKKQYTDCKLIPKSDNVIEVVGLPQTTSGFTFYLDNDMAVGDYKAYTTLYRTIGEQVYQYSNDGSIYVEPEPIPEPEPYVPTVEELAEIARQEKIANIQSQISVIDAEFATLDYVGIKIATGRATVEEYKTEIARMSELAIMKDALEEELKLV